MNTTVRMQIKISTNTERVFEALTDSGALTAWFAEQADVRVGDKQYDFWGRFTPDAPDRGAGRHQLTEVEANRRLRYDWLVHQTATAVDLRLRRHGPETVLTVLHENAFAGLHNPGQYSLEDFWSLSLENLRRYIDGKSCEARVDFSASMLGDIHHEIEVDASPETVFDVLIRPEQLERWIASKATVDPKPGGEYNFGWAGGTGAVKLVDLEPNKKLSYTWPEGETREEAYNTIVTWTLEESGGKTRLTFVHSGFAPDRVTGGYKAGWRNYMNWVRSIAEYGASWESSIVPLGSLPPGMDTIYAASIAKRQHELEAELVSA